MSLVRTSLLLFEADLESRRRARRGATTGDPHDIARAAADRERRGGIKDHHQFGLDLHNRSPAAHKLFVDSLSDKHPHKATVGVAPQLHALNQAHAAFSGAIDNRITGTVEGQRRLNQLGAEKGRASARYSTAVINHGNGKTKGELFHPHSGEAPRAHLTRMFDTLYSMRHPRLPQRRTASEPGAFEFYGERNGKAAAKAAKHHYGDTHTVEHQPRRRGPETATLATVWVTPKTK